MINLVIIGTWLVFQASACHVNPGQPENVNACDTTANNIGRSDYEVYETEESDKSKSVSDTVYVELVVTVDNILFRKIDNLYENGAKRKSYKQRNERAKWDEVEIYIRKFISAVDIRFSQFDPPIKFHIKNIVLDTQLRAIIDEDVLDAFKKRREIWGYVEKKRETCDVILALSGNEKFKEVSGKDGIYGVSTVNGACTKNEQKTIVIQDLGQFSGVRSAIHHLGHMLGAVHDGEDSSASCCSDMGFIMSNFVYPKDVSTDEEYKAIRNAAKFSRCSKTAITKFVRTAACLHNIPRREKYPLLSWQELTDISTSLSLSDQCNIGYDTQGGYCDNTTRTNADPCQWLECKTRTSVCIVKERNFAMEGTACTPTKSCFQGDCTESKY